MKSGSEKPLGEKEFIAGFHAIGEERYHHKHPFHVLMHEGRLTRGQLQAWALNRYYYQCAHSHQRRGDSGAQQRSGIPHCLAQTHFGSRWRWQTPRRH